MTEIEKGAFLKLFIDRGYVLDFSTNDFDVFTSSSIGVPLCKKYGLSKGKSLVAFCDEASYGDVIKLLSDLLSYYELNILDGYADEKNRKLFDRCKEIIRRETGCVQIDTPEIIEINRSYILDISNRARRDIVQGDFDSAITKARTLLEETFIYVLESKDIPPVKSGNIMELYKQVRDAYNMHIDSEMDKRIKTLLSGLNNIVSSISEMRNKNSDAHGIGASRININDYHARLVVNSAITISEFILSVSKNTKY